MSQPTTALPSSPSAQPVLTSRETLGVAADIQEEVLILMTVAWVLRPERKGGGNLQIAMAQGGPSSVDDMLVKAAAISQPMVLFKRQQRGVKMILVHEQKSIS